MKVNTPISDPANSFMRAWLFQRLSRPTPDESEAAYLSSLTGLSIDRVFQWCFNFQRRKAFLDEAYTSQYHACGEASQHLCPIFLSDGEPCVQTLCNDENFLPMKLRLLNRRTIASLLTSNLHKQEACSDPHVFHPTQHVISQLIQKPARPWSKRLKALFEPWRELFRQNQSDHTCTRSRLHERSRTEEQGEPCYGYEEDNESNMNHLAFILRTEAMRRSSSFKRFDYAADGTGEQDDETEMRERLRAVMRSEKIRRYTTSTRDSYHKLARPQKTKRSVPKEFNYDDEVGEKEILAPSPKIRQAKRIKPDVSLTCDSGVLPYIAETVSTLTCESGVFPSVADTPSTLTCEFSILPSIVETPLTLTCESSILPSVAETALTLTCESGILPSISESASIYTCETSIPPSIAETASTFTFETSIGNIPNISKPSSLTMTSNRFASAFSLLNSYAPLYPPPDARTLLPHEMEIYNKKENIDSHNLPPLSDLNLPNPIGCALLCVERPYTTHTQPGFC